MVLAAGNNETQSPSNTHSEFELLLSNVNHSLNELGKSSDFKDSHGAKLEIVIRDKMIEHSVNTSFEGNIVLVSGHSFPDIKTNQYGVEVKSTKQNHWTTTGNSVLESTRTPDIDRIYILFGKLGKPTEFKYRLYQECLKDVAVTHSPRYLIDMNLPLGNSIFDKLNRPYDEIRQLENPIEPFVKYYKDQNYETWWIDSSSEAQSFQVKHWSGKDLSIIEKNNLIALGLTYFPEILKSDFFRFSFWLIKSHSVFVHNTRDVFTASGRFRGLQDLDLPAVLKRLYDHQDSIAKHINSTASEQLSVYWGELVTNKTKFSVYQKLVVGCLLGSSKMPDDLRTNDALWNMLSRYFNKLFF